MFQVIDPIFLTKKELKNLNLTVSYYGDSTSVQLTDKQSAYLKYHKSYSEYDSEAINELKAFVKLYDDEIESKKISETTKLYFEIIKENW